MKTWVFLLFWTMIPIVAMANGPPEEPFIMWDNRDATLEYIEDTKHMCTTVQIIPGTHNKYDVSEMITTTCQALTEATGHYLSPPEIEERFKRDTTNNSELNKAIRVWKKFKNSMGFKEIEEITDEDRKAFMKEISKDLRRLLAKDELVTSDYYELKNILQWNITSLSEYFGYPPNRDHDAWAIMTHKQLQCNKENQLEMYACGDVNKRRQLGRYKIVIPIGKFSESGTIYKFRNISQFAVEIGDKIISADSCHRLRSLIRCKVSKKNKCSVTNYKDCDQEVFLTPSQTLTRYFANGIIIVASNTEVYGTVVNGVHGMRHMENSKHIFMIAAKTDFIVVNENIIYGNSCKTTVLFPISHNVDNLTVTHDDLDKLHSLLGEHLEISAHRQLLEPRAIGYIKQIIIWGIGLLVILSIVFFGIYFYVHQRSASKDVKGNSEECEMVN
ncbi:Protein CBG14148 [Caenorhabditis briggsae]|uniref:Protein CBG14148 n=2 Tax=Caenorhabditis briggsae TaxID=6238 RepID=A8XJE9_CAEBR|nr:Protein CBG14148 [Caenorhabditis briggsae]ULT81693.1 hypothetical protein L3Y34_011577 [Caenorhabditis briggsae]CAP32774.1 Protein CBG14148 [Caenorhabditis briggsae]